MKSRIISVASTIHLAKKISLSDFLSIILPETLNPNECVVVAYKEAGGNGMKHELFHSMETMSHRIHELERKRRFDIFHGMATYYAEKAGEIADYNVFRGRTKENAIRLKSFYCDLDVGDDKPYKTIEEAETAADVFIDALGIQCSICVHSGSGLHLYWALEEPVPVSEWEPIAHKFKDALKIAGLHADKLTANSATLLRPVETTNRKPKYGATGSEVFGHRCRFDAISVKDFEAACDRIIGDALAASEPPVDPKGECPRTTTATPFWYSALPNEAKAQVLRSMLAKLPKVSLTDYAEWLAVGAALACEGSLPSDVRFNLWAEWSQSTEFGKQCWEKDGIEIQQRRFNGLNRSGVGTLIRLAEKAGWQADAMRDTMDETTYLAMIASHAGSSMRWTEEKAREYLNEHVMFVRLDNTYFLDGKPIVKEALDTSLARRMPYVSGKKLLASNLVKDGAGTIVDFVGWKPGAGITFIDSHGFTVANTYKHYYLQPVRPSKADVQTFKDMIDHLANGNQETRDGLRMICKKYSFLHYNPSARIRHATLLIGKNEGCGKSTITTSIPIALFGCGNVRCVETRELSSDFNGYAFGTRIISAPELWLGSRKDAQMLANNLKPLITDDRITIIKKGQDGRDVDNCVTIFASSNYEDAACFGAQDRRYHVISTDAPRMPNELADRIYDLIKNRPGALLFMVLHYGKNGDGFDPNEPPPQTTAKRAMLEANRGEWAQWMHDSFESRMWPFNGDAVSVDDVNMAMGERFRPMPSDKAIRNELLNLADGAINIQAQRKVKGQKTETKRVIVLRNITSWSESGPSAIYDHYAETVIKGRLNRQ